MVIKKVLDLFSLFFYCEKISATQKHVTRKNQLTTQKQASTKQQRQQFFACSKTSKSEKAVCFAFWCFFYAQNLFVKIKINRLRIVLITSNTILLMPVSKHYLLNNIYLLKCFRLALILPKVSTEKASCTDVEIKQSLRSSVSPHQSPFHSLIQSPLQSPGGSSCY